MLNSPNVVNMVKMLKSRCPFGGHWYPCFRFLVTSSLGFKARVGSTLFAFLHR